MEKQLRIGVLTSGGDAPGMNAAIRAVVRSGISSGMQVFGIRYGYEGLFDVNIYEMDARRVSDIIHRGGTMLRTARCQQMMTEEGQIRAADFVKMFKLDALVTIGGNGTFHGAYALSKLGVNVIAIPASIDMDIDCTEYTIGFDTAINTAMEAINRIRDTSFSHERCSVVEVMGRDSGNIALWCALVGGAEDVLIPEEGSADVEAIIERIINCRSRGKRHSLIVVAEGVGGSAELARIIEEKLGIESRTIILGHLQRGGAPTAIDRMHASAMGCMAVEAIKNSEFNRAVIYKEGRHGLMELEAALSLEKKFESEMHDMIRMLSI